jgi:hypothetical protein
MLPRKEFYDSNLSHDTKSLSILSFGNWGNKEHFQVEIIQRHKHNLLSTWYGTSVSSWQLFNKWRIFLLLWNVHCHVHEKPLPHPNLSCSIKFTSLLPIPLRYISIFYPTTHIAISQLASSYPTKIKCNSYVHNIGRHKQNRTEHKVLFCNYVQ